MRLFVAITIDDEARRAIAALQTRLVAALGSSRRSAIKWTRPEQQHLTLVFIGEADAARAEAIAHAMEADVEAPPFTIALCGVGAFPPRGAPRVVWLGVKQGADATARVQQQVAARLERLGVQLEARPFHPHLTLARWRDGGTAADRARLEHAGGDVIARVPVSSATLFESRPSPAGSIYTAVACAKLR